MKEEKKYVLKDMLFNKETLHHLAGLIKGVHPEFRQKIFEENVLKKFPQLELKERIYWIRENLEIELPKDYEAALNILLASVKDIPEEGVFVLATLSDYVEANSCNKKYLEKSLNALGEFTKYCSAEFAIRSFISKFPTETFEKMQEWSKSKNVHQRRLASEGLRPKLPWAKAIDFDYKKGIKVLDKLFDDDERYVTRSVANHMNDISKIDPDHTVETLRKWKESKKQDEKEMKYIIQHSLRTLVKRGHSETLNFLGYSSNPQVEISELKTKQKSITLGETLTFSFKLLANADGNLVIDYKVTYPTPHKRISEKVFKIKATKAKKGDEFVITKNHPFRKMTTKRLYSGEYKLEVQINGKLMGSAIFHLEV